MENDDDTISACKEKLSQFRIKELKDVLGQVGLSKQGKKQVLMDRILALLYDEGSESIMALLYDEGTPGVLFKNNVNGKEGLVEIIDETYRNMQEATPNDSAAKKPNSSGGSRVRQKEEADDSYQLERKIQCPCGRDLPLPLVQCMDTDCNVWQHTSCVIIPEKPMEKLPIPTKFLCEICRLRRANPFWEIMAQPLYPVKLTPSSIPFDGTNSHVSVERSFKLTRVDRDLLNTTEYDVQVWCMLFNDAVPFRIQWPQYTDLKINGLPVKTVNRPGSQQLGANGRDDCAKIKACIVEGINKISLSFTDARRIFCFGVILVRWRSLEQVFGMIPKEADGESFEDALARVQHCIGGGIAMGNEDSDSDLEVIADSVTVSLRCPMSGTRMKTAGRFRSCAHMGCFDLESFVAINERTRKWQCPTCLKNYSLEDLIVDPFFNRILNLMKHCEEEINEIDMKPDGSWRVKRGCDAGDLSKWHSPCGFTFSLSDSGQDHISEYNTSTQGTQCIANGSHAMLDSHMNRGSNEALNHDLNIITLSDSEDDDVCVINPQSVPVVNPPKDEGYSKMYYPTNILRN